MKKLENFIKRERKFEQMREYAEPEDLDYLECQLELKQDLLKSYNNVERIIGIIFFFCLADCLIFIAKNSILNTNLKCNCEIEIFLLNLLSIS